jgi:hypothetical protein
LTGTTAGSFLVCLDGATFEEVLPVTDLASGWILSGDGQPIVSRV